MKRSKFSLSYTNLLTADMGYLLPIGLTEVLPGDSFQHSTNMLIRISPLLTPVMHPVRVRIHHWYVPHRIVFPEWEEFITGGADGFDTTVLPKITFNNAAIGTLADYYGIPPLVASNRAVDALPFRGYARIWNEFYRDQDLQPELVIDDGSGADNTTNTTLQKVGWEKDYFTTTRPWAQKGPEVDIPLVGDAPLKGLGIISGSASSGASNTVIGPTAAQDAAAASVVFLTQLAATGMANGTAGTGNRPKFFADLGSSSSVNVNALRLALALQRFEEDRARYGSRYSEYLAQIGVRSSDARLQRPEYLGGGKQTIQFSEVLQTGPDADDVGVGDLKGHGIGAIRSNRYRRFFEEHGYVHSFLSVLPKTMYPQGIRRHWSRMTKEDYWQPQFQNIGQQQVLNKELYSAHTTPDGVFGYQDRYDEYRRQESRVSGEFRTTLNMWHYARLFASDPTLNASFVAADPTKRVNAVQSANVLWMMAHHSIQARRKLSSSARPSII